MYLRSEVRARNMTKQGTQSNQQQGVVNCVMKKFNVGNNVIFFVNKT